MDLLTERDLENLDWAKKFLANYEKKHMWYETEEKAREACLEKEKRFGCKFTVLKDSKETDVWWTARIPFKFN